MEVSLRTEDTGLEQKPSVCRDSCKELKCVGRIVSRLRCILPYVILGVQNVNVSMCACVHADYLQFCCFSFKFDCHMCSVAHMAYP